MKLVLAIMNYKDKLHNNNTNYSIFIYNNSKCIFSLNHLEILEYFTTFFSNFLSFNIKDYRSIIQSLRKEIISLKT